MMVGLQGSGKTTTTGKLARYLEREFKKEAALWSPPTSIARPLSISCKTLGDQLGMPVFSIDGGSPG